MGTLTIKIPPQLEQEIVLVSMREHLSKSELVRRALVAYVSQRKAGTLNMSALEQAGDLVGCFSGGPSDLSSNPRHLDEFGRV
jgi:Arc/MetJ-type ribon-helix-helix transcriptional regulator